MNAVRSAAWSAAMYANSAARVAGRARSLPRLRNEERVVFVVGSPRSGTTFLAGALGEHDGIVDLGELQPVKAAIPELVALPEEESARRLRRIVDRVRTLGLSRHLRVVEQTPEVVFVVRPALDAFPHARVLHLVRDGRDVVCSLVERGWLSATRGGADDVRAAYGNHPRFWVEPDRRDDFRATSEARRAAWVWRTHVTAGRSVKDPRVLELRYEDLARDPAAVADRIAAHAGLDANQLLAALGRVHDRSVGRWRNDLDAQQLADVEAEAGVLLRELGYADSSAAGLEPAVDRQAPSVLQLGDDA
jgi:Sulfotransferase family